jgi:multidrug efflux pump subunit AcrB
VLHLECVSLFTLILSIDILVDDAIIVVENIHRYMQLEKKVINIICAKLLTKETYKLISSENLSYLGGLS